jgi:hypothetical protein
MVLASFIGAHYHEQDGPPKTGNKAATGTEEKL